MTDHAALRCSECGKEYPATTAFRCRDCGNGLLATHDHNLKRVKTETSLFKKYSQRLASRETLTCARGLETGLGASAAVYLKDVRRNLAGCFKYRAYALTIPLASESEFDSVMTAST